ncbi:hypothetical protein FEM03_05835 [Phragmitibacter flavus]|uniref:Uncharacterized protein n=1 Tax=Phragmitibacter flavus TaxID=2576071 RepID=A0A5R8KHB2_9BACT|nr:hypothetical protein FEM03_05835 [Phragmitibacter flavus]
MPRPRHYVPCIARNVVCALYHEARHRQMPMTKLVNELLTAALNGRASWQTAHATSPPQDQNDSGYRAQPL